MPRNSQSINHFDLNDPLDINVLKKMKTPTKNNNKIDYFHFSNGSVSKNVVKNSPPSSQCNFDQWCSRGSVCPGGTKM